MPSNTETSLIPDMDAPCPCGSGNSLRICCSPILSGERLAPDAEKLMRARFTAHATHNFEFLHRTYEKTATHPFVPSSEEVPTIKWTRLKIHSHTAGKTPGIAYVDFSAYGIDGGVEQVLHENGEFVLESGKWLYRRPLREGPAPFRQEVKKPGRNDPCSCGSGKKYKHCCLGKA